MIKMLHIDQHNRASLPAFRKQTIFTPFCSEFGLGVVMKVVDLDVISHFPLV